MRKIVYFCLALLLVALFGCSVNTVQGKPGPKPAASSDDTVPAYVKAEAKRVSGLVRAVQNPHTFTIIGVSDLHYLKGNAQIGRALNEMALGVKEISSQVPVDYKIAFGDYIYRSKGCENYRDGVEEMQAATGILDKAFGQSGNQIRLTGNHDANAMELDKGELKQFFTMHDLYGFVGKYNGNMTTDSLNPEGNYGYIDIPEKKIRIICLNTSDFTDEGKPTVAPDKKDYNKNTTTTHNMSKRQAEWLIETLKLKGIEDPEAWNILPVSHLVLSQTKGGLWKNTEANAAFLLSEYVQKHKGTFNFKGRELPYDYSGITPARVLPYIHGHNHAFTVKRMNVSNISKDVVRNEMVTVGLPNACPLRNAKGNTYTKTEGTAKSTAFSVIVIDLKKSVINIFCYGAGFDRIIHFNSVKMKADASHVALHTALQGKVIWKSQDKKVVKAEEGKMKPVSAGNTLVVAEDEKGNCEYWNVAVEQGTVNLKL